MSQMAHGKAENRDLGWSKNGDDLATVSEKLCLWHIGGEPTWEKESVNLPRGAHWKRTGSKPATSDKFP